MRRSLVRSLSPRSVPLALAFSLLPLALACSKHTSVSESQCAAGDWETIGYRDGALGWRSSRLLAHQDVCIPLGVTPDRMAYQRGWKQGIEEFCNPDNGYALALPGTGHDNVCPAHLRDAFLAAYDRGWNLYSAQARVDEIEETIANHRQRLVAIEQEMVATATAQLDPLLLPAHRIQLAARVKQLYDEKGRITAEIPQLERELQARTAELEALNRSMAAVTR